MNVKLKTIKQRGDTIIEVLLSIAIVSAALAISYATMSRNFAILEDNQERSQAIKIIQGQVELVRSKYATNSTYFSAGAFTNFCMTSSLVAKPLTGSSPNQDPANDNWSDYPAECSVGPDNQAGSLFHIGITTTAPNYDTFKFYIRWDRRQSSDRSQVVLVYKVK